MENARIALIDVLDDPPFNIVRIFQDILTDYGFGRELFVRIDGLASELPSLEISEYAGIIISGSVHSIYDDKGREWKGNLYGFIQKFYDRVPILGVCFGHQAIAYALGGKVEINPKGREVGIVPLYITSEARQDVIFEEFKEGALVPQSHLDCVSVLPEGATKLAYNESSSNQAFRIGKSWGIQFHPELKPSLFKQLLGGRIKKLRGEGKGKEADDLQDVSGLLKECPEAVKVLIKFVHHCLNNGKGARDNGY